MLDDGQVVADEDQGDARVPADGVEELEDLGLDRHVQGGHRLVQDEDARFHGERPCDGEPLPPAAGEAPGPGVGLPLPEAGAFQEVPGEGLVAAVQAQGGAQALGGGEARVEGDVRAAGHERAAG
ncbi:hypothetical protein SUDANB145_00287 [Streptomyces sp. enrichment culture]